MKLLSLFLLLISHWGSTFAASDLICTGDSRLNHLRGLWVLDSFSDRLVRTRSWSDSLTETNSTFASIKIDGQSISFNLGWHEGDSGEGNCVRLKSGKMWARPGWQKPQWVGSYSKAKASTLEQEAGYFLSKYLVGCFSSEIGERWCLSSNDISVDGKSLHANLQMDISEGPLYGTAFAVPDRRLPFLVFVPRPNGWAVFEDDWASAKNRIPIDPLESKPWRNLER